MQTLQGLVAATMDPKLNKPDLGRALVERMFEASTIRPPLKRPISRFLIKVVELASRNHQPSTHAMWEYNQRTGFLGTLKPGAVAKRRNPYGRPRQRKTNLRRMGPSLDL